MWLSQDSRLSFVFWANLFLNRGNVLLGSWVGGNVTFSAIVWKEGKTQVAWSSEFDIASQGKNVEEALGNLKEAVELYLEDEDAKYRHL
jgi:predicted RNase H-like HicB family nuclease